jgi:hypothetical protein
MTHPRYSYFRDCEASTAERDNSWQQRSKDMAFDRSARESALRDDRIVVAAVTCCPLSWSTTIG